MNNLAVIPRRVLAGAALGAVVLLSGCGTSGGGSEPVGAPASGASASAAAGTQAAAGPSAEPSGASSTASSTASPTASSTAQEAGPSAGPSNGRNTEPSTESQPSPGTSEPSPTVAPIEPAAVDPAGGGTCTAAMLTGSIETAPGAAAMGSVYRSIVLTNTSSAPCTTAGFPGVSAVTAEGNQVGSPADRDGSPLTVLTLAPGDSATASLKQGSGQNYGADCGTTPVAGLRIYPPGATDSLVLEQPGEACSASSIVLMTVGTLQPAQ